MVRWMSRCGLWGGLAVGLLAGCQEPIVILEVDGVPAAARSLLLRTRVGGKLGAEAWFPGEERRLAVRLPGPEGEPVTLELHAMLPGDCVTASARLDVATPGGLGGWARHAAVLVRREKAHCDVDTVRGTTPGAGDLRGVWMNEANGLFAAGAGGEVTYCPAGAPPCVVRKITQAPVPPLDFYAVWGGPDASVYLAGNGGIVIRCQTDKTSFDCKILDSHTKQSLRANWGARDRRYYAVGDGSALVTCDVRSNDCRFKEIGVSSSLNGVWGTDDERVFVVGDGGILARCSPGGPCVQEVLGTNRDLYAVWGRDAGHVYVVGDAGTVVRCTDQPGSCRSLTSNTTSELHSVWGTDAGNVYVAGSGGTMLRCADGADGCTVLASGTTQSLLAVRASDAGNAYVVGEMGTVLRCSAGADSCSLLTIPGGTKQHLRAVFGTDADNVYFAGDAGTILRRKLH